MQTLQAHALSWEMYGVETIVSFSATATDDGFHVTLERDNAPLITGKASDSAMLLRVSKDLRQRLNHLGYVSQPEVSERRTRPGGLCWGPAAPLDASLITTLCTMNDRRAA